mgnify:CR=1 FL=1
MIIKDWQLEDTGCYYARCDGCMRETNCYDTWHDCKDGIKKEGWKLRKNWESGEWEHICPYCQNRNQEG